MVSCLGDDAPLSVLVVGALHISQVAQPAACAPDAHQALNLAGGRAHNRLVAHVVSQRFNALGSGFCAVGTRIGRYAILSTGRRIGLAFYLLPTVSCRIPRDFANVLPALTAFQQVVAVFCTGRLSCIDLS